MLARLALLRHLTLPGLIWLALTGAAARADQPSAGSPPAAAGSPEETRSLIATLQDDNRRQALIAQLQVLLAAQQAAATGGGPADSGLLDRVRDRMEQFGAELADAATVILDMPAVVLWAETQLGDPGARARWVEVGRNVALILGTAVLADWFSATALAAARRRLLARPATSWPHRLWLIVREILLDALPVAVFAATAYAVIPMVHPRFATQAVVTDLVGVMLVGRLALVVARAVLLVPRQAAWALLPVSEESATYLYIWIRRFVVWGIYVYGVVGASWWLGIPGAVFGTLQKAVVMVATLLAIMFVLQNRHAVAEWIRPRPARPGPPIDDAGEMPVEPLPDPVARHPALQLLRYRLAEIWHVLAVVYIAGIFCVYALRIEGGFGFLFRATVLSVALIALARLTVRFIGRLAARGFAVPAELGLRFPTLEFRANRYLPLLTGLCSAVVWSVVLLAILEVWGVRSFTWLGSELGRRAAGSALSVALILLCAFGSWEVLNATIDRYLAGLDSEANRPPRVARMRTLLPLLRNALWFTILVIAGLLVLSALDVNIVPLLAGASVVGLAVGIGSQALVKDVITGLFILIEDTLAVGDVVDLGGQHAGVVEAISIRTVKLRDTLGAVHTVPFSEISKIKNLSRDYAYWMVDLALPYTTDPDRVLGLYRSVLAELRQDPDYAPLVLGELEPLGVTAFNATTIQIQALVRTLPLKQWKVGREFNRRLRRALAESGLPLPTAVHTIALDERLTGLVEQLALRTP